MTSGRAAWNVVTSLNNSEAHNMGRAEHAEHDLRYDMADEFMEIVLGHWDSWEDDAIVVDKASGLFAHPDKVHQLGYKGKFYQSKGPFTVPRSAQGRPVVIQAGQSGRGQAFSARWGELVFWVLPNLEIGKRTYDNFKRMVADCGRDPDSVAVAPAIYVVPAETKAMAEDKMALIDRMAKPVDGLALLSEALNFDFYAKPMDSSFTDEELAKVSGLRAIIDRVVALSGKKNPTIRDFVQYSSRGTVREFPRFVGTPKEIADGLEEWFGTCCDGFVIAATHIPGSHEDFVRLVVPELQRRGLHHKDYKGATLRDNLGLPKAERGDWQARA
jgi:FMN-dependent oxidoreductase (nitrilotriacetate monooxygenase family)